MPSDSKFDGEIAAWISLNIIYLAFQPGIKGHNRRLEEADRIGSQHSFGDRFKEGMLGQVQ